jgi:hypothetical protein
MQINFSCILLHTTQTVVQIKVATLMTSVFLVTNPFFVKWATPETSHKGLNSLLRALRITDQYRPKLNFLKNFLSYLNIPNNTTICHYTFEKKYIDPWKYCSHYVRPLKMHADHRNVVDTSFLLYCRFQKRAATYLWWRQVACVGHWSGQNPQSGAACNTC